ncbi:MAG TPA: hypothetical protein EYP41_21405 [Anaerolineae bacterium]|nr:hypothetical protein [Anaerolineae bacterium]HIP72629.1 hypothetical protein [Anaerolineae bacterium]
MSTQKRFALLQRILKTLGLSDDRIEELITHIQEWLLDDQAEKADTPRYPYHLRDDFLSPAELNFYRVLRTAVSDWAIIFTKVSLGDLFLPRLATGDKIRHTATKSTVNIWIFCCAIRKRCARFWALNWMTKVTNGQTVKNATGL